MYNDFAINSYLTFRFVYGDHEWKKDIKQFKPKLQNLEEYLVDNSDEIINAFSTIFSKINLDKTTLLISGGIDSAILASFLKKDMKVYSIKFEAENSLDETIVASQYAKEYGLNLTIIKISFNDYLSVVEKLIKNKNSPLHPIEPALYLAAQKIKSDGFDNIITGFNADIKFGGLDLLLAKNWEIDEFIKRFSFVDSKKVLENYIDMKFVFKKYLKGKNIDTILFLKEVYGYDTSLAFLNSIRSADCDLVAPYSYLKLKNKLDIGRIRNGESKYHLKEVFKKRYKNFNIPKKISFARPLDQWLYKWDGPKRNEFKQNINISEFNGNQKWLIYCLEYFLNFND